MSNKELERKLEQQHEKEDKKRYRDLIEQSFEDELDQLDLPHDVIMHLHRR